MQAFDRVFLVFGSGITAASCLAVRLQKNLHSGHLMSARSESCTNANAVIIILQHVNRFDHKTPHQYQTMPSHEVDHMISPYVNYSRRHYHIHSV